MIHLSGMDASFLHLETPEMPMHVGSLQIADLPEGYAGDYYEDVKRWMATRMHLASVFQRKLALMPFDLANPVWVDDEDVDLDYHVRHVILPRPGTMEQLEKYVARLHSSLLDRSRPLWEIYVIEGLHTGQVAIYNKMHHSAIDGQAGVAIAKALLSGSATPPPTKPPRQRPRTNRYQLGWLNWPARRSATRSPSTSSCSSRCRRWGGRCARSTTRFRRATASGTSACRKASSSGRRRR